MRAAPVGGTGRSRRTRSPAASGRGAGHAPDTRLDSPPLHPRRGFGCFARTNRRGRTKRAGRAPARRSTPRQSPRPRPARSAGNPTRSQRRGGRVRERQGTQARRARGHESILPCAVMGAVCGGGACWCCAADRQARWRRRTCSASSRRRFSCAARAATCAGSLQSAVWTPWPKHQRQGCALCALGCCGAGAAGNPPSSAGGSHCVAFVAAFQ